MASLEQRVGQLEGAYNHLTTKADLSQMEARLTRDISNLKSDINKVIIGLAGLQLVGLGAVAAIMRFLGT